MTIVWFQDLDPLGNAGGAQLNDRGMIIEGLKRGHDIVVLTPQNQNTLMLGPDDFFILSNITAFPAEKFLKVPNRFAVFHHDWWFRCRWRLYFPVSEKCISDCPQAPQWEPVMKAASLHVFLSPLHYQLNRERFGDAVESHILVPSCVNPDLFFDFGKPDRAGVGNLNGLISFKGRNSHIEHVKSHPGEQFTFAGDNEKPQDPLPSNAKFVGPVPEGQLAAFYNRFETYMELPDTPQPFNRTVAEAYLSGCKIRGNGLVGALSWPWFSQGRQVVAQKLRGAPGEFWRGVEAVL